METCCPAVSSQLRDTDQAKTNLKLPPAEPNLLKNLIGSKNMKRLESRTADPVLKGFS